MPTNAIGMLQNIKILVEQKDLFNKSFYDSDSVIYTIGGKTSETDRLNINTLRTYIMGFEGIFGDVFVNGARVPAADARYTRTIDYDKVTKYELVLIIRSESGPMFEEVEHVFGHEWQRVRSAFPPPHSKLFKAPSHPHGNDTVAFEWDGGEDRQVMTFEFGERGRVEQISCTGRKENAK